MLWLASLGLGFAFLGWCLANLVVVCVLRASWVPWFPVGLV